MALSCLVLSFTTRHVRFKNVIFYPILADYVIQNHGFCFSCSIRLFCLVRSNNSCLTLNWSYRKINDRIKLY